MQCCIGDSINVAMSVFNTLRPRQNGRHFPNDLFKRIFLNENVWISLKIPFKLIPNGPINNISALVQIMVWRRPGDKSLSEAMVGNLLTHICVSRPHWVNPHNVKREWNLFRFLYTLIICLSWTSSVHLFCNHFTTNFAFVFQFLSARHVPKEQDCFIAFLMHLSLTNLVYLLTACCLL